jgi:hypothetical protein
MKDYLKDIQKINYTIWDVFESYEVKVTQSIREIKGKVVITQFKEYEYMDIFRIDVDIGQCGFVITDQMYEERFYLNSYHYDKIYIKKERYDYKTLVKKFN